MKTSAAIFALTFCVSPVFAASLGESVVLPMSKGEEVLDQCSRSIPENVTGFWQPEAGQIADLDDRFDEVTAAALAKRDEQMPVQGYDRQYVGIISNGQKLIYVNAFVLDAAQYVLPGASDPLWRTTGIQVCDGGSYYFGAVYNPATGTFSDFAFNRAR